MLQTALCNNIRQFSVTQFVCEIEQKYELFHTLYYIAMNDDSSAANRALLVCEKLTLIPQHYYKIFFLST